MRALFLFCFVFVVLALVGAFFVLQPAAPEQTDFVSVGDLK
jgi:hypothetical protein